MEDYCRECDRLVDWIDRDSENCLGCLGSAQCEWCRKNNGVTRLAIDGPSPEWHDLCLPCWIEWFNEDPENREALDYTFNVDMAAALKEKWPD